jgi:hypothetical protein
VVVGSVSKGKKQWGYVSGVESWTELLAQIDIHNEGESDTEEHKHPQNQANNQTYPMRSSK